MNIGNSFGWDKWWSFEGRNERAREQGKALLHSVFCRAKKGKPLAQPWSWPHPLINCIVLDASRSPECFHKGVSECDSSNTRWTFFLALGRLPTKYSMFSKFQCFLWMFFHHMYSCTNPLTLTYEIQNHARKCSLHDSLLGETYSPHTLSRRCRLGDGWGTDLQRFKAKMDHHQL